MKTVLLMMIMLLGLDARATEIEVTSDDCNFEVRQERDAVVLKVNKIIAIQNSISGWDIELPNDKIKLPLPDGFKKKMLNPSGEEILISYKNGVLTHDHKAKSNFTRDTLELSISPDLKHIRHAKFVRKGSGILALFGSEKFECKF